MVEADRPQLAQALAVLADTFDVTLSTVKVRAYYDALRDLPIESVIAGCHLCLRSLKFFPKPIEIREAVQGPVADQAEVAWALVLREIGRVGWCGQPSLPEAALATVRAVFGSWRSACEVIPDGGPEAIGWAKQFKAAHGATLRQKELAELTGMPTQISQLHPKVQALIHEHLSEGAPSKGRRP